MKTTRKGEKGQREKKCVRTRDENGNKDSDTLDPIYWWFSFGAAMTKVLEEAERQRDGL